MRKSSWTGIDKSKERAWQRKGSKKGEANKAGVVAKERSSTSDNRSKTKWVSSMAVVEVVAERKRNNNQTKEWDATRNSNSISNALHLEIDFIPLEGLYKEEEEED